MNDQAISPPADARPSDRGLTTHLLVFFALVYVVEGVGQVGGLIAQPLSYYLKQAQGWTPLQVTAYLAIFNFPWIIKPVYGAFSDFVPLFGYRRKSYLIAANIAAVVGFVLITQVEAPSTLVWALQLTAYAMAISSTVCGAVLVEQGQRLGQSGKFVNQQWLWFNFAAMLASILGGQLVQHFAPGTALHAAAALVAIAPVAVLIGSIFFVPERKARLDAAALRGAFGGLAAAFKKRELWVIAIFLFFYYFSPGLSTPLYYVMTDDLKFSQAYIGGLGSIASAGWVIGALSYRRLFGGLSSKRILQLSIVLGTATTAAYLLLYNEASAAVLSFCSGFSAMLATVATVTLAADYCPQRSEGFSFAVMMSIINLATATADIVGSLLFQHLFDHQLAPLILVSAAFTALAFVLLPLLHLGDKPQGTVIVVAPAAGGEL
jgi:MFS family permease